MRSNLVSRNLLPQGRDGVQAVFAQVDSQPDKSCDYQRHDGWLADAHVRCGRSTQIAGEQDGSQDRRPRDEVEHPTDDLQRADGPGQVRWIAEVFHPLRHACRINDCKQSADNKQEGRQRADHATGPEHFFRYGSCCFHDCSSMTLRRANVFYRKIRWRDMLLEAMAVELEPVCGRTGPQGESQTLSEVEVEGPRALKSKRKVWWRRWELNPRPKILTAERLHACSVHAAGITQQPSPVALTNGQETQTASLMISSSLHRRSSEDQPVVRRPSAAHG